MEIVLASHSNLSVGMKETTEFIMGKQDNLHANAAYVEEGKSVGGQLEVLVSSLATNEVLFITDLKGGSVNSTVSEYMIGKEKYFLISGMNLALVLELLSVSFKEKREEVIKQLEEIVVNSASGTEVIDVNNLGTQIDEDF